MPQIKHLKIRKSFIIMKHLEIIKYFEIDEFFNIIDNLKTDESLKTIKHFKIIKYLIIVMHFATASTPIIITTYDGTAKLLHNEHQILISNNAQS